MQNENNINVTNDDIMIEKNDLENDIKKESKSKKGNKIKEPKVKVSDGFEEEIIEIRRVTRVTAGGRRLRFSVLMVVGDKAGRVGYGLAKANDVSLAITKASRKARKKLIAVPIVNNTIPHEISVKFHAARIHLMPAKDGTGVISGGAIRRVVELAGIKNIYTKIRGSTNKINNVKAIFEAFKRLNENMAFVGKKPDIEVDLNAKKGVFVSGN